MSSTHSPRPMRSESSTAIDPATGNTAETAESTTGSTPHRGDAWDTSWEAVSAFSSDFGEMITGTPRAVYRPLSPDDIGPLVGYARTAELTVAMNGQSGTGEDVESHSSYGQAQTPDGISIDARGLARIVRIGSDHAVVEAGVQWGELLDAALEEGLTPPVLPDYLHLSIGGTLSLGGIGGTVQKYGFQVDTVRSLDVVTGDGELVTTSPTTRPDLFNAVLAGGGQCGIILRATVNLVPAPIRVVLFNLYYDELSAYLSDAEKVLSDGRFDLQEGELQRRADGTGWRYKMGVASYYSSSVPDQDTLLAGLRDDRAAMEIRDIAYRDYMFQLDELEASLKEAGYWNLPKPWLSLYLPASQAKDFLELAERELSQEDLGRGLLLVYPYFTGKVSRPLAVQPAEPVAYLFDLLRFPAPGADVQRMLDQNRLLYEACVRLGGKRYLVGAVPGMTPGEWQQHFGATWSEFMKAKQCYDPANILTPGQGIFG